MGSSRAAQGLQPQIIKEVFPNKNLYNYAFLISLSPYGEAYFKSIKKKINENAVNGLFLVCVNPWTISSRTKNPEDSLHFREINSFIDNTNYVNLNPNIEYIAESFNGKNKNIIVNRFRKGEYQTFYVHNDGWLEVTIESDMISREKRTKMKMITYRKKLNLYSSTSVNRLNYLKKTIQLFDQHGDVYLVRIPVNDEMLDIENELVPDLDDKMLKLSNELKIDYLNMMPFRHNYSFTDGNHLDVTSGKAFSKYLAGSNFFCLFL